MVIIPTSKQSTCSGKCPPGVIRFLGIAIFLAGAGMLIGMWSMEERARSSQAWPTTVGQVIESRVEERSGEEKKYRSIIRYAYTVDGAAFESERYSFGSSRRSKKAAEKLCAQHPAGSTVQVYYDPAKPAQAVLVLQPAGRSVPLGIAGALVMAAGAFLFTLSFRTLGAPAMVGAASV